MVNAATPWTVRTTKRTSPNSAPNPRKRPRTIDNVEDGPASTRRKPRQQTLTQIQFAPHRAQDNEDDDLRPIATVPRRVPAQRSGIRLQKRNSTLTQMDFIVGFAVHDHQKEELTLLQDDEEEEDNDDAIMQVDGTRDTPNPRRKRGTPLMGRHTSKRKATPVVLEDSQEFIPTRKKRKSDNGETRGDVEPGRRTSRRVASVNAARSIGLLSATTRDDHDENWGRFKSPSIRSKKVLSRERSRQALLEETTQSASDQDSQPPSRHKIPRAISPSTPSKKMDVIPSSQSPESLPPSTRRRHGQAGNDHILSLSRSPLKERSTNAQLSQQRQEGGKAPSNRMQAESPLTRKICVLKLPTGHLRQEQATTETHKTASKHSIWSLPSSSLRMEESETAPGRPVLEVKDSTEDSSAKELQEQSLRAPTLEVKYSVPEDEPEIPATSQLEHQLLFVSSPNAVETQETLPSLRGLLGLRDVPNEETALRETNEHNKPELRVIVKVFALGDDRSQACRTRGQSLKQEEPPPVGWPGDTCIADSGEEGSVLALSPGSSIANDTQFNAALAQRIPTSSADVSPSLPITPTRCKSFSPSLQLDRDIELSLPRPNLVHQQSTYSTTKTVPLNDTSSPSLPPRSTQRTVYPASLPRPSQISTQDPTQQYLPTSSMPLQCLSSPLKSGPPTITIKDSSSVPRPLRGIPSQSHSQPQSPSQLNGDLGLDDCLDPEDDDDLDKGLVAMSDEVEHGLGEEEESQVILLPPAALQDGSPAMPKTKTAETGSPVRRRRPRKPVIPPEVRALLGESLLESVPGPPGWSQGSWDDEPL